MDKAEFFREARDDLTGPLAGLRVVEATTTWAGPMCGCLLADFGADVVVENFRPGTLAEWGLGYEEVRAARPDVVYVSISGYGQYGPQSDRVGYDPLAQAESGFLSLNGSPDGPPVKSPTFLGDDLAGLHAAFATDPPAGSPR